MTRLFVPAETAEGETRVAATPETVKGYLKLGLEVAVEPGAGLAAGFPDEEYATAGAKVEDGASDADLVIAVGTPDASRFKKGCVVVSSLVPATQPDDVKALRDAGLTSFGLELVPRITRAQKMDILSSQATCAGYKAVLIGAAELRRFFPLLMTAAGTIRPSKVLILGAGVAGLQAIATAKRLGAQVEANDLRPAVKEQVESLGAKFVDTGTPPDAETSGGYAAEAKEDYLRKQREILTEHVADADLLITTALIPGRPAPRIISADMLKGMKPGSVVVDVAAPMGGNVEGTVPGSKVEVGGVTILGHTNLPALCATDASRMWARNVLGFVELFVEEGNLKPDHDDEVLVATRITHGGEIALEAAKTAVEGSNA
ncbi:MAG: NAD(P) transhydrogenase subunit alpha [Planctomycetota bacterium]